MKQQWLNNFFLKKPKDQSKTIFNPIEHLRCLCYHTTCFPRLIFQCWDGLLMLLLPGALWKTRHAPSPCLITPALPFHSSQPPPSHLPILCEPHQSKSSSRIANASDGSTSPGDPEVEEFFAAYWGHFPPPCPSLSLAILHSPPPKCFFSINRGSQLKLAFNFLPNPC